MDVTRAGAVVVVDGRGWLRHVHDSPDRHGLEAGDRAEPGGPGQVERGLVRVLVAELERRPVDPMDRVAPRSRWASTASSGSSRSKRIHFRVDPRARMRQNPRAGTDPPSGPAAHASPIRETAR